MADLQTRLVITAVDKMSQTVRRVSSVTAQLGARSDRTRAQLVEMGKQQKTLQSFKKLSDRSRETANRLKDAQDKAASLGRQMSATEKPSKSLQRRFAAARAESNRLKTAYQEQQGKLNKMRTELGFAAKSSRHLEAAQRKLRKQISATEHSLGQQQKALEAWDRAKEKTGSALGSAKRGALWGAGIATGAGALFNRTFVKTAAEFERFQTILKTVEGSSDKAQRSMDWISDFAARTPFEIAGVTDSFVKLRAYGLDPIEGGLLQTLGDTAAAMGKPMEQAVEAIADAVTGENERLKEFGIKASAVGDKFVYEYTANGQTMRKAADKSNRAMIQSTLQAIWNDKYAGAMDDQSKTWNGMLSNLGDQWTRFQVKVMQNGVLDKLKDKLGGVLDRLNQLADTGELDQLAVEFADRLITAIERLWEVATQLYAILSTIGSTLNTVANAMGGWENVIYALIAAKFISWAWGVASAVKAIGVAAKGSAVHLTAMKALGGGLSMPGGFDLPTKTKGKPTSVLDVLKGAGSKAGGWFASLGTKLAGSVAAAGIGTTTAAVTAAGAAGYGAGTLIYDNALKGTETSDTIGRSIAKALAFFGHDASQQALDAEKRYNEQMRGEMKVVVEDNRVSVKQVQSSNMDLDVTGLSMGAF